MSANSVTDNGSSATGPAPELPLYAPKPPVTRINRRAIVAVGFLAAALGAVVLVIGFSDHRQRRLEGEGQENSPRPSGPLEATRDLPKDYSFDVRQAGAGVSYDMPALVVQGAPAPATRPGGPTAAELAAAAERQRLAELRQKLLEQQRKEMEQALDSPLLFANAKPTKRTASPATAAYADNFAKAAAPSFVGETPGFSAMPGTDLRKSGYRSCVPCDRQRSTLIMIRR